MKGEPNGFRIERTPLTPEMVENAWTQIKKMLHPIYSVATHFYYHAAMSQAKAQMANWHEMEDVTVNVPKGSIDLVDIFHTQLFGGPAERLENDSETHVSIRLTAKNAGVIGREMLNVKFAQGSPVNLDEEPSE